jgi:hypothetical protein
LPIGKPDEDPPVRNRRLLKDIVKRESSIFLAPARNPTKATTSNYCILMTHA